MRVGQKRAVSQALADALRQARERLEQASTPQALHDLQQELEGILAQVEDHIILAYERGKKGSAVLQAAGEVLSYAMEMLVEREKAKALRALDRALAMLASSAADGAATPRKGGIRRASSSGGLPRR